VRGKLLKRLHCNQTLESTPAVSVKKEIRIETNGLLGGGGWGNFSILDVSTDA
jgi:hypothetical protein